MIKNRKIPFEQYFQTTGHGVHTERVDSVPTGHKKTSIFEYAFGTDPSVLPRPEIRKVLMLI